MILSHRIRLRPTDAQERYFKMASGCSRLVWNWGVAEVTAIRMSGGVLCWPDIKKRFNSLKYRVFPWMKDIHRDAHSQPFSNLRSAYVSFFKGKTNEPKYKRKGRCRDSFYIANDKLSIEGSSVRMPLVGRVKMREALRLTGKVLRAIVSRSGSGWYVSISVDVGGYAKPRVGNDVIGVDLGIKSSMTMSSGEIVKAPLPMKQMISRIAMQCKSVSRKVAGSKNRLKAIVKLRAMYLRVSNIRDNWMHQQTSRICRENQAVVIEDLSVLWMLKNSRISRVVADSCFAEFKKQMTYKSEIYGSKLIVADRFYPSSKKCSKCGSIKDRLHLRDRVYDCEKCGLIIDRGLNAALNLHSLGLREHACG